MRYSPLAVSVGVGPYLGVLGGMGPLATADFMTKIIAATPAKRDQDHVPMIVRSVPQIPDRTACIVNKEASPLPALVQGLRELCASGAGCIAITCNTAHYWYDDLAALSPVPILHIADTVAQAMTAQDGAEQGKPRQVGVLATRGTVQARIYQDRLSALGMTVEVPSQEDLTTLVMPGIEAVKAGDLPTGTRFLEQAARRLVDRGVQDILLACTEIPLALKPGQTDVGATLIDPTDCLAHACVDWWRGVREVEPLTAA